MDNNDVIQNAEDAGTALPAEPETQQAEENEEADAKQQQEPGTDAAQAPAEDGTADAESIPPAPFLTVRHNREDKPLSSDEAKSWAEKGMHYQSLYDELDYLAAQNGVDVNAYVKSLNQQMDDAKRAELTSRFGEDTETIDAMMRMFHEQQKERYDKVVSERDRQNQERTDNINRDISNDFRRMQVEYPELSGKDFSAMPEAVKKAAFSGVPLEFAYLKFQREESKNIEENKKIIEKAAEASTGSMESAPDDNGTDAEDFKRGVWSN